MIKRTLDVFSKGFIRSKVIDVNVYLRSNFCVLKQANDETMHQSTISILSENIMHEKNQQVQQSINIKQQQNPNQASTKYNEQIDIYKENKRRLYQDLQKQQGQIEHLNHEINNKIDNVLFDEQYLKKLISIKYYYADIVNVASLITEELISKIQRIKSQSNIQSASSQQKQVSKQLPIRVTHLHFLLYVYHLYPKQSKNIKDRMIVLIEQFIDSGKLVSINIQKNMEFFFFLRKFIQNQDYHKINKNINAINVKYVKVLKMSYILEKKRCDKNILQKDKTILISQQICLKAQLLHNYLLVFPNLWNIPAKQGNNSRIANNKLSPEILQAFDFFVEEFSQSFTKSINFWLNSKINDKSLGKSQKNVINKRLLQDSFKEMKLSQLFSKLKLLTHRLYAIFDPPKNPYQSSSNKSNSNQNIHEDYLTNLSEKYLSGKMNILAYLPVQKLQSQSKLLALLILIKKLASYHLIRNIDNQALTNYLLNLFENNSHLISTKKSQSKREIKYAIGEIISKLASSSWVDWDDQLSKFFVDENLQVQKSSHQGKRNNKGQWYEIKDY